MWKKRGSLFLARIYTLLSTRYWETQNDVLSSSVLYNTTESSLVLIKVVLAGEIIRDSYNMNPNLSFVSPRI